MDCTLRSGDDCTFGVCSDVIKTGSIAFRRLFDSASRRLLPRLDINAGVPDGIDAPTPNAADRRIQIDVPEGGEITLALIHALYPQPFIPIENLELAENVLLAVQKYNIDSSQLRFESSMFDPARIMEDPLRYCAFAWRMDLGAELKLSSRYALHLDLARLSQYRAALQIPEGVDVLAALLATNIVRNRSFDTVVDRLPRDLMCPSCREEGRTGLDEMKEVVENIFEAPHPDLHTISHNESWAASVLAINCRTERCESWLPQVHFSEQCKQDLARAMLRVPQEVNLEYLVQHREHSRVTWQ